MSAQDPLSEAREALREVLCTHMTPQGSVARSDAMRTLARLDALPAPEYRVGTWNHPTPGWFYPDAPVARDDGGDDA